MSVTYVDTGYYSSVTGDTYPDAASAHAAESQAMGGDLVTPPAAAPTPAAGQPSSQQVWDAAQNGQKYARQRDGSYSLVAMTDAEKIDAQQTRSTYDQNSGQGTPQDPNEDPLAHAQATMDMLNPPTPKPTDVSSRAIRPGSTIPGIAPAGTVTTSTAAGGRFAAPEGMEGATTPQAIAAAASPAADPNAPTGAPAPKVDTSASDASVAGVNNTINQLVQLANTSPTTSAAEAQLEKSDQLAKLRAADELRNNQASALGAARSSRNRADAGVLERSAVGESAYLGTKAQQQDVMRQAELEGNQAILRANEETDDKKTRAEILGKAADLGLNVAALQVDISKADLGSINNYINDQFQQLGIDKQVGAEEMGQILSFSQAMSAIKYDYDKMSDADQQHTLDLMMQQYGIDQNTAVAMKQIQSQHKGTLEKVFDGVLGLAGAVSPVAASVITAGAKKPGGTP